MQEMIGIMDDAMDMVDASESESTTTTSTTSSKSSSNGSVATCHLPPNNRYVRFIQIMDQKVRLVWDMIQSLDWREPIENIQERACDSLSNYYDDGGNIRESFFRRSILGLNQEDDGDEGVRKDDDSSISSEDQSASGKNIVFSKIVRLLWNGLHCDALIWDEM